jgi:hypothetical protein
VPERLKLQRFIDYGQHEFRARLHLQFFADRCRDHDASVLIDLGLYGLGEVRCQNR